MIRTLVTGFLLVAMAAQAQQRPVTYAADIKPILDQYCVSCHSGWFPKGQLRLDSRENILEGGKKGPAILPGKPDKGWLINLATPKSGRMSDMPPGPERLSDEQLALIRAWIAQGAR